MKIKVISVKKRVYDIKSIPKKSSQLSNRNARQLISFFESQDGILYLYGPSGSGKTFGVELLAEEFAYDVIYIEPPFSREELFSISSSGLLVRKMVLIDCGVDLSKANLMLLGEQDWSDTRLIIIGQEYPKDSPIRSVFKDNKNGFRAVKFYKFDVNDILGSLSTYSWELGVMVSYDVIKKIAEAADGDMRSARIALKAMIASKSERYVNTFLPMSEHTYFSLYDKLFSGKVEDIEDAVNVFGSYVSMIILRNTILKSEYSEDLLDIMQILTLNLENSQDMVIDIAKLLEGVKSERYMKPAKLEVPDIDVKCSSMKKLLYLRGYAKWLAVN